MHDWELSPWILFRELGSDSYVWLWAAITTTTKFYCVDQDWRMDRKILEAPIWRRQTTSSQLGDMGLWVITGLMAAGSSLRRQWFSALSLWFSGIDICSLGCFLKYLGLRILNHFQIISHIGFVPAPNVVQWRDSWNFPRKNSPTSSYVLGYTWYAFAKVLQKSFDFRTHKLN